MFTHTLRIELLVLKNARNIWHFSCDQTKINRTQQDMRTASSLRRDASGQSSLFWLVKRVHVNRFNRLSIWE